VIGAGVSGLKAAGDLQRAGASVCLPRQSHGPHVLVSEGVYYGLMTNVLVPRYAYSDTLVAPKDDKILW
jgi:hypothetical protein